MCSSAHHPPTHPSSHRCFPSSARCYTGLQSLCLTVPSGLAGGAYVDTPVKTGWLYIVKVRVFREQEEEEEATQLPPGGESGNEGRGGGRGGDEVAPAGKTGSKLTLLKSWATGRKRSTTPAAVAAKLVLWDLHDMTEASAPAVKTGEWEVGASTVCYRM